MIKKLVAVGILLIMILGLSACGDTNNTQKIRDLESRIENLEKDKTQLEDDFILLQEENEALREIIIELENGDIGYQSGDGTQDNPFVIQTYGQLKYFADTVNLGEPYLNTYFALNDDINLGGTEWRPIGISPAESYYCYFFRGHFDGSGHKITNFKITTPHYKTANADYAGLFGCNLGTILNLGVDNFTIDISIGTISTENMRIYAGGLAGINDTGTIQNCYANGSVSVNSVNANAYAGGLIGYSNGAILNSYAAGDVGLISDNAQAHAGGFIGYNGGTIINSYATGDVSLNASSGYSVYAGGFIGYSSGNTTAGYATGNVSVVSSSYDIYAGGFVGIHDNSNSIITKSFAIGNISVITPSDKSIIVRLGGFAGDFSGNLNNCFVYYEQLFYTKKGNDENFSATNNFGTTCEILVYNSASFYTNLLNWDTEIWDFTDLNFDDGKYPVLKNAV